MRVARFRFSVGLAVAVPAALLLLLQPAPALAFCGDPVLALNSWKDSVPENQCSSQKEGEKFCAGWLKQCKKVVKGNNKCRLAFEKVIYARNKQLCKLDNELDPKGCLAGAKEDDKNVKDEAKDLTKTGLGACANYVPTCITLCVP